MHLTRPVLHALRMFLFSQWTMRHHVSFISSCYSYLLALSHTGRVRCIQPAFMNKVKQFLFTGRVRQRRVRIIGRLGCLTSASRTIRQITVHRSAHMPDINITRGHTAFSSKHVVHWLL
jgi:hypothetical protein